MGLGKIGKSISHAFKHTSSKVATSFNQTYHNAAKTLQPVSHAITDTMRREDHLLIPKEARRFMNRHVFGELLDKSEDVNRWMRNSRFARKSGLSYMTRRVDRYGLNPLQFADSGLRAASGKENPMETALKYSDVGTAIGLARGVREDIKDPTDIEEPAKEAGNII